MSHDETERQLAELQRLSAVICKHLDEDVAIVRHIDDCLAALAKLRPDWEIVLAADILLLHQSERRSQDRRLLSAAIRLPGGVAVGILDGDEGSSVVNGDRNFHGLEGFRFLPFNEAPALIQRLVLPLIPYTLEALCDQLESRF